MRLGLGLGLGSLQVLHPLPAHLGPRREVRVLRRELAARVLVRVGVRVRVRVGVGVGVRLG